MSNFIQKLVIAALLCCINTVALAQTVKVYAEKDGLVIMEMENTSTANLGKWVLDSSINGFTGESALRFTGNKFTNGSPNSPLEFKFKINKPGLYHLHIRCAKETIVINGEERDDVANDAYVRVEGDYTAGPNAGDDHGDNCPLENLKQDTKFYGGRDKRYAWTSGNRLDLGGHNNKRRAVYNFKAGEEYTLVVSGRSKQFRVDRLMFRHQDITKDAAEKITNPESNIISADAPSEPVVVSGETNAELFLEHRSQYPDFDSESDLLVAGYDNAGDPDDLHSQAALGSMFKDPAFAGIKIHGVMGAGSGTRRVQNSSALMNLVFGQEDIAWTHVRGQSTDGSWLPSVHQVRNLVLNHIRNNPDADIWIAEGGPSNFTYTWIRSLLDLNDPLVTEAVVKQRFHLVQHSIPNQAGTKNGELALLKELVDYIKIHDGNYSDNEMEGYNKDADYPVNFSPDYETDGDDFRGGNWVTAHQEVPYHQELRRIAKDADRNLNEDVQLLWETVDSIIESNSKFKGADYSVIPGETAALPARLGLDFSDHVETVWILSPGESGKGVEPSGFFTIPTFWKRFVINKNHPALTEETTLSAVSDAINIGGVDMGDFMRPTLQTKTGHDGLVFDPSTDNIIDFYQPFGLTFGITLEKAQTVKLTFKYKSQEGLGRSMNLFINGKHVIENDSKVILSTSEDTFQTRTIEIFLPKGVSTIELREIGLDGNNALDVHSITVTPSEPPIVVDTDGDGISDEDEALYGTNPNLKDSDGDGIEDGDELGYWGEAWNEDIDNDGVVNLLDADSDNDSVSDGDEILAGTDPAKDDNPNRPVEPHTRINAGGGEVESFLADSKFTGGKKHSTSDAISLPIESEVNSAVYQTERYGNFSYIVDDLEAGFAYTVRLHFAEIYWKQAGQRVFDVNANDVVLLKDFDIFLAAGGENTGIVREFTVTADDDGVINLEFISSVNFAKVSAIEILTYSAIDVTSIGNLSEPAAMIKTGSIYSMAAAGKDIWDSADEFGFASSELIGDGEISTQVLNLEHIHDWSKAGIMIRESLEVNSKHAMMVITPARGASFQYRLSKGARSFHQTKSGIKAPAWLKLNRTGDLFTGYYSIDGENWLQLGSPVTIKMSETVFIGLCLTSHDENTVTIAEFDNLSID